MGVKSSKVTFDYVRNLNVQAMGLESSLQSIKKSLTSMVSSFASQKAVDEKIDAVEQERVRVEETVQKLHETSQGQLTEIGNLKGKFAELFKENEMREQEFIELAGRFEERLDDYQGELYMVKNQVVNIEGNVLHDPEIANVMGVHKTANMISKKPSAKKSLKKSINKSSVDKNEKVEMCLIPKPKEMPKPARTARDFDESIMILIEKDVSFLYNGNESIDLGKSIIEEETKCTPNRSNFINAL